jgi:hypothetical protein
VFRDIAKEGNDFLEQAVSEPAVSEPAVSEQAAFYSAGKENGQSLLCSERRGCKA